MDLEEYDFVVEYIKGKDNVAADALSRITIDDLKEMYPKEESILVTTRAQARKRNEINKDKENEDMKVEKVKVYEEIGAPFDKKLPRIRVHSIKMAENAQCAESITLYAYSKHKKLFELQVLNLVNERLSPKKIFSELDITTKQLRINKIQWPINDKIFEICDINEFKRAGNEFLKHLEVALIKSPRIVKENNEKLEILHITMIPFMEDIVGRKSFTLSCEVITIGKV